MIRGRRSGLSRSGDLSMILVPVAFGLFLMIGCTGMEKERKERLATLDSLSASVQAMKGELNRIDRSKGKRIKKDVAKDMARIKELFSDTVEKRHWSTFSAYKEVEEGLAEFDQKYKDLKEEMQFTEKQLLNLRQDIQGRKWSEEKEEKYFKEEKRSFELLKEAYVSFQERVEMAFHRHDSLGKKVDSLIRVMEKNKKE